MTLTEFKVAAITSYATFFSDDFTQKYALFLKEIGGIYPLIYAPQKMALSLPLFSEKGEQPFFITVFLGARIVAFLPLQVERFGCKRLFYKRLRLWGKVGRYNDNHHADFLCLPPHQEEAAAAAMDFLKRQFERKFDEIILGRIPKRAPFFNLVENYFPHREVMRSNEVTHLFTSDVSLDDRIKGESRRKIRKANEALVADFKKVEFSCITHLNESLLQEIITLHIERQQSLMETGRSRMSFFEDKLERDTVISLLKYAEQNDALRIYTLRLDSTLTCFLLCISCNRYTDAVVTAFKEIPSHKHMARCLWHFAFKQELETYGTRVVDMGYGTHPFKTTFSTSLVPLETLSIKNRTRVLSKARNYARALVEQPNPAGYSNGFNGKP